MGCRPELGTRGEAVPGLTGTLRGCPRKRPFADGAIPTALEPVSVSATKGGTIVGVYRPNGKPSYDSY
ncbi:hypothetical protein GCM10014715_56210 [Streptomyces spiralis]|uniref:Uncharacterized protein n=1 Tax=Streptomyces spiralis TaxID=66376 RepID=A0A919A7L3_9ACTN|nr:hypothetical protein GCM10014715_56210 [Streptomyces spiralis]